MRGITWLGRLCVLVLLLAATVQATHFCGLQLDDMSGRPHLRDASPGTTLCLTCLMVQTVGAILFLGVGFVPRRRPLVLCSQQLPSKQSPAFFHLYVRPPPAL